MDWYAQALVECAPWGHVLLFGQVVLLALLVERAIFLVVKFRVDTTLFLTQVRKLVLAGNASRAAKLAAAVGDTPLGKVCKTGLDAFERGPFVLQEELDRVVAEQAPMVRRRVSRIPLISVALAVVGVVGSKLLGAEAQLDFGGDGPLPFGLAMPYAPALIGVTCGLVGIVGWLLLAARASKAMASLEQCKKELLDLRAQVKPASS